MARQGRKRKIGKRERNGRLQRERGIDPNEVAGQLKHRTADVCWLNLRRAIPIEKRHDPKAEHVLGRYNLAGALSDDQYDAGHRFKMEVIRFRAILEGKRERESVAGFGQPSAPTRTPMADEEYKEYVKHVTKEYREAFEAIEDRGCQCAVKLVVIQDQEIDPNVFRYLDLGLSKLVAHYGLTK